MNNVILAILLTVVAGLSTGIGSLIALFSKKTSPKFLSISLGFSAGVMLYVSFAEIFVKAKDALGDGNRGLAMALAGFFGGILIMLLVNKFIPDGSKKNESLNGGAEGKECGSVEDSQSKLRRTGFFTALAIAIHNFPEGMATFVSALQSPSVAVPVIVAIAIHNIPEGIAVSAPIYCATGSRKRAFLYSFLSGLTEPLGAIAAYLILMPFMNDTVFGILFAAVAGIMVFISVNELLPAAHEYGGKLTTLGFIAGMAIMALSLLLVGMAI